MNVSLTPELEQFIAQQVQSGMYQTPSDVIREGLRLLRERDELRQKQREELRREIAFGMEQADQGKVASLNAQATLARVRKRGQHKAQDIDAMLKSED
jgi:antitoxin ParD1/3/4